MKDEDKRSELSSEEIAVSLQLISDLFQDLVAQTDVNGIFLNVSPSFHSVLGYSQEELLGKTAFDLIHPDDVPILKAFKEGLESKTGDRAEYRLRHTAGHYVWLETSGQAVLDDNGKILAAVFSSRDITARRRVEEERNRIFELSLDMLCVASLDGYFVELNPAWEKTLGWSPEELKAKPYLEFVHPEDLENTLNAAKTNLESTPSIKFTNRYQCKDGTYRWLSWSTSPHSEPELVYCVVRDVTERKETAEALQKAHDKLEEKVKERTAELSRANEELRSEITERKQAEEETRRWTRRTESLLKISSRLNAELELDKVHDAICEETCNALHTQMAAFLSYDSNTRLFHLTASVGLPIELARASEPLGWEIVNLLFAKLGKAGAISDLAAVPELPYAQTMLSHGIQSIAYSFIERQNLPLGILVAGDDKKVDFTGDPLSLLSGLADQSASAVTNAQLLQETKDRLRQVQALRNIDLAITGSLDLRVTFQVVLDEVTGMLNTDAAAILLLDPYSGTLRYEQWSGFQHKDLKSIILPQGKGYSGRAAAERQSIHIADLRKVEPDPVQGALLAEEGFAAYFAVPLIAKGTLRGVLEVYHREPVEADGDWLAFLETLAVQAAIAVDNAELFSSLERSSVDLLQAYDATIEGWAHALDLKDEETKDHSQRVTEMTLAVARKMNIKDEELAHLRRGALLHDIGKMGIPDAILLKPGKLNDEEWEIVKKHPVYSYEMLAPVDYLRPALDIPYCHHEKWDGSGYTRGLKGKAIPLAARIFAVVDVYDALTSNRPYRKAWSREEALEHIKKESGSHFDPEVVEVFLKEIENIAES